MLTVKSLVTLMPLRLREKLKSHPKLTAFYTRSLQKSGLFYGFPSRAKLERLYHHTRQSQQALINAMPDKVNIDISYLILVPIGRVESLRVSLESLHHHAVVMVVCRRKDQGQVQKMLLEFRHLNGSVCGSPIDNIESETSIFAFYAGQKIHPDLVKVLYQHSLQGADVLYVDTDMLIDNKFQDPIFLPQWSPDLQLTTAYVRTGVWFKSSELIPTKITNHSQTIAEWMARIYLENRSVKIERVPYALLHKTRRRKFNYGNYADTLNHLMPDAFSALVVQDDRYLIPQWHPASQPLVSLIIPTKNAKALVKSCIESILRSKYQQFEIILVDNQSDDDEALQYFAELDNHPQIRVLRYDKPFNYSAINNFAASQAQGEIIGLINNDIEVIAKDWLTYMVGHVQREDIGCVGAKLLYPDDRIQHAGVVMGYGGGAGHAHKYFPRYHPGYIKRLFATNEFSAVTAACLLVKKSDFDAVGGLDESIAVAFNDVDFCMKILTLGRRNLYCAEALLYHHESISRGHEDTKEKQQRFKQELALMQSRWQHYIDEDPCYNPNLTLRRENFSIKEVDA